MSGVVYKHEIINVVHDLLTMDNVDEVLRHNLDDAYRVQVQRISKTELMITVKPNEFDPQRYFTIKISEPV